MTPTEIRNLATERLERSWNADERWLGIERAYSADGRRRAARLGRDRAHAGAPRRRAAVGAPRRAKSTSRRSAR